MYLRQSDITRADHLLYVSPDLHGTCEDLAKRLGIAPDYGGRHPGRGTENAVLGLGPSTYLEVIGPDSGQAQSPLTLPFGLATLTSPALKAWAIATDDIETAAANARESGYDPGAPVAGSRRSPTGELLRWRRTIASDAEESEANVVPFLIDWGSTHHPAADATARVVLAGLSAVHPEPEKIGRCLHALGTQMHISFGPVPKLLANLIGPGGTMTLT